MDVHIFIYEMWKSCFKFELDVSKEDRKVMCKSGKVVNMFKNLFYNLF